MKTYFYVNRYVPVAGGAGPDLPAERDFACVHDKTEPTILAAAFSMDVYRKIDVCCKHVVFIKDLGSQGRESETTRRA
eukprot:5990712-Pyramimonas_sp.AAC.1